MTVKEEFFESFFHYSMAHRLFTDAGKQICEGKGTPEERQALVNESLRLSLIVSDYANETESLIPDTIEFVQTEMGDLDLVDAVSRAANIIKEDRAQANDYYLSISSMRMGNGFRKPRRPQIANPFVYVPEEEAEEEAVEETDPEVSDEVQEEDASEEQSDEVPESDGEDSSGDAEVTEDAEESSEEPSESDESDPEPKKKKKKGLFRR